MHGTERLYIVYLSMVLTLIALEMWIEPHNDQMNGDLSFNFFSPHFHNHRMIALIRQYVVRAPVPNAHNSSPSTTRQINT